jgi:murein L,D-transpeptidase YcbB/YkuD
MRWQDNILTAVSAGTLTLLFFAAAPIVPQPVDTSNEIRTLFANNKAPVGETLELPALRAFYERRSYQPAWTGGAMARAEARQMVAALADAEEDGLDPQSYHAAEAVIRNAPQAPENAAEFDVLLSDGALRYVRDLRVGRSELEALDPDVELPKQIFDPVAPLQAAIESNNIPAFLSALAPPHPEYARLKAALARYRGIALRGGWPELPASFPADPSNTGDMDLLRQRLAIESGGVDAGSVRDAVMRFQTQHGLAADGSIGPATLQALNVPATERAMEIAANMERWRWLPRNFEANYVVVDVPDQHLSVIGPDGTVLTSRVVVGKPASPTPLFRAVATSVTINPPWNVPDDIARREILSKLRANPDYLVSEHMILRDGPRGDPFGRHINWKSVSASRFHYHFQQQPGPKNALGTVKLELPNRFNVYLHYTSAAAAFGRDSRDLSHGCVRVEQILPLASYALSRDPLADITLLQDAIAAGKTEHLPLNAPLPIYFLYRTAFVDADGVVEFRPDIYGRDVRLIAALGDHAAGMRMSLNTVQCVPA